VVAVAYVVGAIVVLAAVAILVSGRSGADLALAAGLLIQGLLLATFIALIGRYAQMRAEQARLDA
jgi:uncharacterized transporter YbjL